MDVSKELSLLCENTVEVLSKEELQARLEFSKKEKKPLRIKAGFDPSAPDIHLGHTVLLRKLRQFQDLGHKVIFIIGNFTATIGDPTGQNKTRPFLSEKEVEKNARTYQKQAFKILDNDPKKIEIVRNNSWLGKMPLPEFVGCIASEVTVARVLERDDFEKRMAENQPIMVREFLYPLLQGYDSVAVKADVELGGTDQKFNLLMGRQLQKTFGQLPQIVMTLPLLVGLDGSQKMSKSLGNYVAVTDSPKDVFGKIMSIPDALMEAYFNLLTDASGTEIQKDITSGKVHPRDAKEKLAKLLTEFLHSKAVAEKEAGEFSRVFKQKNVPSDMLELKIGPQVLWIVDLLKQAGVPSGSEARRLIKQQAVDLLGTKDGLSFCIKDENAKISFEGNEVVVKQDPVARIPFSGSMILRIGKTRFVRIKP